MKSRYILAIAFVLQVLWGGIYAQTVQISGRVVNEKMENIPFAAIKVKNSEIGTVTDVRGEFKLELAAEGKYILLIRHSLFQELETIVSAPSDDNVFTLHEIRDLDEVFVLGNNNRFKDDSSFVVGKLPLSDLENPQVYNSIKKEVLQEQNVTNFNDALKNATGITRLWESTGRGGDGGEFYAMRGFAVQPSMVNGLPSVSNGVIDPANVESIEVIKGPSGTLFGSPNISYGGLINVTTKKPYDRDGGEFTYTMGNFGLNRLTIDLNKNYNEKAAIRLNGAFQNQDSYQDAGFRKSYYFAPSFRFQPSKKLTFLINTEFNFSESANAPMLFLSRYSPVTFHNMELFENNYRNSYTSNDLTIKNNTVGVQGQAFYKINNKWTSQTAISTSNTGTNGYYHYLWDLSNGESFYRYMSKRNGETQTIDVQQNFLGDFKIGGMRNRIVVGIDYYQSDIKNSSTGWVGNGIVNLATKEDDGRLTQIAVDSLLTASFEGVSTASNQVSSIYFSDVVNILPQLSAMVSLRLDQFQGSNAYWTTDEIESQLALSPKLGLVYQPIKDKVSLFGNYMNGFSNIAPVEVADADGSNVRLKNFEPEQANQYEFGVKTNVWKNKVSFTGSYYNILVSNKLMQDPNNINNSIQGAEVLSQGIEASIVANPLRGLNLMAGYSINESKVTKDDPTNGYLGLRPEEAGPAQLINFWVSYVLPVSKYKGLGIGFGGNAASENKALNRSVSGEFVLPAYQIFNASLFYRVNNVDLSLRINNLMNEQYYSGWSGVNPQQLRSVSFKLGYRF